MVKTPAQPDALLGWMDGLADPTRLRLLRLLEQHELGVVELCDVLQLPQSTVSRHLKVLADQGFVRNQRQGTTHLYRMPLDELDVPARRLWLLARDQTQGWATFRQDELRLERRLRDRQADGQVFFAGAAGQWDKLRTELYGQSFTVSAMLALLPADYVVADLGCGTGPVIAQLAPHVRRVIGVDNSPAMLKAAQKRLGNWGHVELLRGDLSAVPIEDCTCDAAMLILALTYVGDPGAALREMTRVLKPGGRGVVVDLLPHDREAFRRQMGQTCLGFEPQVMEQMMLGAGLTGARCQAMAPEPNAKGPALFWGTGQRAREGEGRS
ncbi:MAG TPA: metalloregulator ArsR/SmtB family transcription factor [Tepidisphaeraceae bacterium]|nr:metalloregulator ArsR/SmtB family transcription factor [Tepidisphaeraceae bacterium]